MSDARLAKVIWQTAKLLLSLLEKEYGFQKPTHKIPEQLRDS